MSLGFLGGRGHSHSVQAEGSGRGEWERKAFWEEVLLEPDHVSRMHLMDTGTRTKANYGPRSLGWWDTARGIPWTLCLPTAGRPLWNMRWV